MNVVLIHEIKQFNDLLSTIQGSISDLNKVIQGKLIMSRELEEDFKSLLVGKVPDTWLVKSYPTIKSLANYISDLCDRLKFFNVYILKYFLNMISSYNIYIIKGMGNKRFSMCVLDIWFFFHTIFSHSHYAKLCTKTSYTD